MQVIYPTSIERIYIRPQSQQKKRLTYFSGSVAIMKANEGKCHVLLSSNENLLFNVGTPQIQDSNSEKLIEIKIDSKLI